MSEQEDRVVTAGRDMAAPAAKSSSWLPTLRSSRCGTATPTCSKRRKVSGSAASETCSRWSSPVAMSARTTSSSLTRAAFIAWRPHEVGKRRPGHLWRWEFESLDADRTRVTHTYDWTELTDSNRRSGPGVRRVTGCAPRLTGSLPSSRGEPTKRSGARVACAALCRSQGARTYVLFIPTGVKLDPGRDASHIFLDPARRPRLLVPRVMDADRVGQRMGGTVYGELATWLPTTSADVIAL